MPSLRTTAAAVALRPGVRRVLVAAALVAAAGLAEEALAVEFVITGTAADEVVATVKTRLELQWSRYESFLPPRIGAAPQAARLPEVRLFRTSADYRNALAEHGVTLENPAVFLRDAGVILLGYDGAKYDAALEKAQRELARKDEEAAALTRAFYAQQKENDRKFRNENTPQAVRNDIRRRQENAFQKARAAADAARRAAEAANRRTLSEATDRLLAAAAHELFHAYVATRLYPPADDRLPAWLHEGLAQLIEHGRWRNEQLLIDPPPPELLQALKAQGGAAPEMPDLRALLTADGVGFLAHAREASADVRRRYLTAWSLTQYLASGGMLARRAALDEYALATGGDPVARFERFAGRDAAAVEAGWHAYLRKWVK